MTPHIFWLFLTYLSTYLPFLTFTVPHFETFSDLYTYPKMGFIYGRSFSSCLLTNSSDVFTNAQRCVLPVSFPVEFLTMAVINPTERKLAKRTSVQCVSLIDIFRKIWAVEWENKHLVFFSLPVEKKIILKVRYSRLVKPSDEFII